MDAVAVLSVVLSAGAAAYVAADRIYRLRELDAMTKARDMLREQLASVQRTHNELHARLDAIDGKVSAHDFRIAAQRGKL